MANLTMRVVLYHKDASGNTLKHFPTAEQFIISAAGTDYSSIKTVLNNNGKLRGTSFEVHSSVLSDRDQIPAGVLV